MEIPVTRGGLKMGTVIYDENVFNSDFDPFISAQPMLIIKTPEFIKHCNDTLNSICSSRISSGRLRRSLLLKVEKVNMIATKCAKQRIETVTKVRKDIMVASENHFRKFLEDCIS